METLESPSQPVDAPVLGYAIQRKRWERGVFWLTCIVTVAHLLTFPLAACYAVLYLDGSLRWYFGNEWRGYIVLVQAVLSLATAFSGLLLVLHFRWARRILIACTVLMTLLGVATLVCMISDAGRLGSPPYQVVGVLGALSEAVVWCYPLILLSVVFNRRPETARAWSAAAVWWMTAIAAMLVALPTVFEWLLFFEQAWGRHIVALFSAFIGEKWWRSFTGIGAIAGSMACVNVFGTVAWTLYRGVSGRWALMICAALWIVFAAGSFGTIAIHEAWLALFNHRLRGSPSHIVYYLRGGAFELSRLAGYMAFPLAIRVALTLSDVRARLEKK